MLFARLTNSPITWGAQQERICHLRVCFLYIIFACALKLCAKTHRKAQHRIAMRLLYCCCWLLHRNSMYCCVIRVEASEWRLTRNRQALQSRAGHHVVLYMNKTREQWKKIAATTTWGQNSWFLFSRVPCALSADVCSNHHCMVCYNNNGIKYR